jgi:hypothetical protein
MLAAAIADLEPDIVDGRRKVGARVGSGFKTQNKFGQQGFAQMRLMRGELRPLAPAVEKTATPRRIRRRA